MSEVMYQIHILISAIRSNVMDSAVWADCFEMVILMSSMWFGWFIWLLFCHYMTQRQWQQHVRSKIAQADAHTSDVCADAVARVLDVVEDSPQRLVDDAQSVRRLLENYGVFGASPGAWVAAADSALDAGSEASLEADDAQSDDLEPQDSGAMRAVTTETSLGALFEHYALFGAELGTWRPSGEDSDEASNEWTESTIDACDESLSTAKVCTLLPSRALQTGSADEADSLLDGPSEGPVAAPRDNVAQALFEQYSLFGAEPRTWSTDSDCSTGFASESESAEAGTDMDDV
jgi:hypothetical protein